MKERRISTKQIAKIAGFLLLSGALMLLMRSVLLQMNKSSFNAHIRITATREDDSVFEHSFDVSSDGEIAKVNSDFYKGNVYVVKNKVIFDMGSKYIYYEDAKTIGNLKAIIDKIKLGSTVIDAEDVKSYNPDIEVDVINDILKMLFIDKVTTMPAAAHIIKEKDKLKSFSLYLVDIEGFKDINITISFEELKEKDKLKIPVLYEDIMERIDFKEIVMIK